VISGFRRDVDEICALLGYYAASTGNPLPTFRDNVLVPTSRVKKSMKKNRVGSLKSRIVHLNGEAKLRQLQRLQSKFVYKSVVATVCVCVCVCVCHYSNI
jgi:hypothetical protein